MSGNIGKIQGPQVLLDVWQLLLGASFGFAPNAATTRLPKVLFLSEGQADADETVRIRGAVSDGDLEWRDTGRIIGETFSVTIEVDTRVTGASGPDAVARSIVIAEDVQAVLRDDVTGLPTGLPDARIIQNYRMSDYALETFPLEDKGYGCTYEMTLRVNARH